MNNILIVGAGPVGLTVALELLRRGYQPRIVDRAMGHPSQSRALAVHSRTLEILQPSGLTPQFLDQGNQVTRLVVADDRDRPSFEIDLRQAPGPYKFILVIPQGETESLLAAHIQQQGIAIEWQTEVTHLTQQDGKISVRLLGPQGEEQLTPDLVIGADGAHSFVRKSLGLDFDGERRMKPFGLVDVEFTRPIDPGVMRLRMKPEGLLGFFPIHQRMGRYVATDVSLIRDLPDPDTIARRVWESEFHVSYRHARQFQLGNVFLAGDAAHIHSPVGGRGMNLGMEDAAWLAWLISQGKSHCYTAARLPVARYVLKQTAAQTRQLTAPPWARDFLFRFVAPVMLRWPMLKRLGLRRIVAQDTRRPPWLDVSN